MPFSFGMPTSRMMASGLCSSHRRSASRPSAASATTLRSGCDSIRLRKPAPDDGVIVSQQHAQATAPRVERQPDGERRALAGRAAQLDGPAQLADALLDAAQPEPRPAGVGIEADAIVAHRHLERVVACADADADVTRARVTHAVGQRFLNDAIDARAVLIAQAVERVR